MVFVRFNIFAFRLVQVDTDVRCKWREWDCLGVDAGISSRFEYAGGGRTAVNLLALTSTTVPSRLLPAAIYRQEAGKHPSSSASIIRRGDA